MNKKQFKEVSKGIKKAFRSKEWKKFVKLINERSNIYEQLKKEQNKNNKQNN
jgi:isocitrate dehydrogenase kinase/phosphatase